jgi:hypothetical protein
VRVAIAVVDIGLGVQLQEALDHAGFDATLDAALADGPRAGLDPEVVILDADHLGAKLGVVADQWRDHASVPGVVAIGSSGVAREQAPIARVALLAPGASIATVASALREASKLRFATDLRWTVMRAAMKLPPARNEPSAWAATLLHARNVDLDLARSALRWRAQHYATPTAVLDQLREERVLTVPELGAAEHVDGTRTVQTLVKLGPLDPTATARLLWALASLGAIDLTPGIRDQETIGRRALDELREHLRTRKDRLVNTTHFDVLELTPLAEYPDIERAYQLLAARYSPRVLERVDLAELVGHVQPLWAQVEAARNLLVDDAARGRYMDWLRQYLPQLKTIWAIDTRASQAATDAFTKGQQALGEGDAHRAMSSFALAARHHPGHPDYEANLAWVRHRVQTASGKDVLESAHEERRIVEGFLTGRRPWPRALVALALLCVAGNDAEAARWHLRTSLAVDPTAPAAVQLAKRLGLRR